MAADDTRTVTAKFVADISNFQSNAKQVVDDAKAAQAAVAEFLGSTKSAAGGLSAVGSASSASAEDADKAVAEFLGLSNASNKVGDSAKKAGSAAHEARGGFNEWFDSSMQIIGNWQQLIAMIGQFVQWIGQARDAANATAVAFTYLSGSAQKAQQEIANLYNTSASKAFGTQAIDNAAQHFLMLGKNADTTQKEIERVSDAIAAMGGDAKQITPVIESLHKIQDESKVTKEDIDNLAREGIASWQALADGMSQVEGHTVSVAEAQKRVEAGAVSGKKAYEEMMQGMIQYTGAAEDKSHSLGAEWQRLGENASKAFGPLADLIAADLEQINELLEGTSRLSEAFASLGNAMRSIGTLTMPTMGLTGFASGVIDSPVGQFAMVGEEGPELMYVPQGSSIFPNGTNPFAGMSSGGSLGSFSGGSALSSVGSIGNITIHLTTTTMLDSRVVAQQTIPHIAPILSQRFGKRW